MSADDGPWALVYESYEADCEGQREALCAVGNGYFVTRAAAPESGMAEAAHEGAAGGGHYPGTYVAGLYNRLESRVGGKLSVDESLVNLPNWLALGFRIDAGPWFCIKEVELLDYCQALDLRAGLLTRRVRFADARGRITRFEVELFAHMRLEHFGVLRAWIVAENWSGELTVRSALDGRVCNAGVARYREFNGQHLEALGEGHDQAGRLWLRSRTVQSRIEVALACTHRLAAPRQPVSRVLQQEGWVASEMVCALSAGESVRVDKVAALFTSRDPGISECLHEARKWVARAEPYEILREAHIRQWDYLWTFCDLDNDLPDQDRLALRVHIFHLLQTVSLNTIELDAGLPARGWHGEAYRGHVFWDELFAFPYLNFRLPEVARALLLYRYRRLPEARHAAQEAGYRGAMVPWQSGSDGREETQRWDVNPRSGHVLPDHTHLQRHVGAAVAYNVWCFDQVTGDRQFLYFYGAEMVLEIARFFASLAEENATRGRYEIRGVMGPDEFHTGYPGAAAPGIANNAYTNVMAAWVLWRALGMLEVIPGERREALISLLALKERELERWEAISRRLFVPFHEGVISQFEGYEALEELDWDGYRRRHGDIQRMDRILEAEDDTPNRYKLSKQADALMLFYLFDDEELAALFSRLGYPYDEALRRRTVDYYLARTSHGSTLSRVVHSWVFARGRRAQGERFFFEALHSDLADIQGGSTAEGVHLGAMAGSIDLVQRAFAGLSVHEDGLAFAPCLPSRLTRLSFRLRYRESWLQVRIDPRSLSARVASDARHPVRLRVQGEARTLRPGEEATFAIRGQSPN